MSFSVSNTQSDPVVGLLPVSAIVLAAGLGRRMKTENKLLALLDGVPLLRRVVSTVLQSDCQRVIVVLGHESERIQHALADLDVDYTLNPDYLQGMGSSVGAGAKLVEPGHAALVVLGDMPLVQPATLNALIAAYRHHPDSAACVPVYNGKRGNPVLWAPSYVPLLQSLSGDEGARSLLLRFKQAVHEVTVAYPEIHTDIDTPDELARGRVLWAQRSGS